LLKGSWKGVDVYDAILIANDYKVEYYRKYELAISLVVVRRRATLIGPHTGVTCYRWQ
jgi:hypothetical protein